VTAPRGDAARLDVDVDGDRLAEYLRRRLTDATEPLSITRLTGGHSNVTYLLSAGLGRWVLRRPPGGCLPAGAHDVVREHRILAALSPAFPLAPRPVLVCSDESVIGTPFFVMEYRPGVVVRSTLPPTLATDVQLRRRLSEALIDTLATLHAVDWVAIGLGSLGRPEGFLARQVRRWAERYDRVKTRENSMIPRLGRWLAAHTPPSPAAVLIHNDFKLDNVVLGTDDPSRPVAVLDWELATIGDPLVDLGVLLCHWAEPRDPGIRKEVGGGVTVAPGFLTRAELVARYAEVARRDVSAIRFYETFALYRVSIIEQQIYHRFSTTRAGDERFATFEDRAWRLAEVALDLAEGGNPA
jgi:aminoglycoside phosphotransferase (APT) family kinase protein